MSSVVPFDPRKGGAGPDGGDAGGARLPPYSDEAETALLAALIQSNKAYEKVEEFLKPEHFATRIHGRIYEVLGQMRARGTAVDQITLRQHFEADPDLEQAGGYTYIIHLSVSVVSIFNVEDYGRTIHELFVRRQLIELGQDMVGAAFGGTTDPAAAQLEEAERRLAALSGDAEADREPVAAARGVAELLAHMEVVAKAKGGVIGIGSGIPDLDRMWGGMLGGDLVFLAGRPGMGKTDLGGNIADNNAAAGIGVVCFSLEMSRAQLWARSVARRTGIAASRLVKGGAALTDWEWEKVTLATNELGQLPLFIDDTPGLSVGQIRARARRMKRRHKIGLVMIDHLQLLSPDYGDRSENRVQELTKITKGLKITAKQLGLPVIVLSQLNRAVENREDKRPHLSDLRDSGSIEQDADVVGFLYRASYYLEKSTPQQRPEETGEHFAARVTGWEMAMERARGKAEISFEKVRFGSAGMVELAYDPATSLFSGLYREELPNA